MTSVEGNAVKTERPHAEWASKNTSPHPCHVLLTTASFGGHERMLLEWLREAGQQRGLDIRIHSRNISDMAREFVTTGLHSDPFAYAIPSPSKRFCATLLDLVTTFRILRRMPRNSIALFAPGVAQAALTHILLAALFRRRVASYVPMAYASRDMRFRYAGLRDWIARQVIRHVDIWITITEHQRQLLKDYWRIDAPIYVVPNRLQLPDIATAARSTPNTECRPIRVLFLGRFDSNQKGLDWLVSELRQHRSSWIGRMQFVFKGQGEYEQDLQQLAVDMPRGAVSVATWGDVLHEMQQADVLLLPSRFEGFPLVAVEATHYGVPIVASSQAGLADVLQPECIFPLGDFEALIKAIDRMQDPLTRMSAAAFSLKSMQPLLSRERFEQAVANVIREFSAPRPDTVQISATS